MSSGSGSTNEAAEISLLPHLNPTQLNCLNEMSNHTMKDMFKVSSSYLESDVDEQLLLNVIFNQRVRVKSISFHTNDEFKDQAPKDVHLLINKPAPGFEDVEDASAIVQKFTLTADDVSKGKIIPLRYVKFQIVHSLHIFVSSNAGEADTTRIDGIEIFGSLNEVQKDRSGAENEEDHSH